MELASTPNDQTNRDDIPKSHFKPTVCLTNWWLIKTENETQGRRLGVAGFTSREKQAMRVFSSAPILKRYDLFTIETTDGICVILEGFINRDHTVENGFPSDEYVEKFMDKESSSKDVSGFNTLNMQSPQSGTMEGEQIHVDSHEKDLGSEDKMDVKRLRRSKRTKSSAVSLTQKYDNVISGSQENLSLSCGASTCLEKESYSKGPTLEDQTTQDMPVNCKRNKVKSLSHSSVRGNINISAVDDKVVEDSQVHDTGGILSACDLHNRSRSKKAIDNLRKVELGKRNSTKANLGRDMSSSSEMLSHSEGRIRTRRSLKMEQKNNQTSARISGQKIRSSVSSMGTKIVEFSVIDCEPGGRNSRNFEVTELQGPTDKSKLSELDAGSAKDRFEQVSRTPNQDKDLRKVKTKGNTKKTKDKATRSLGTLAAANNQKDNVIPEAEASSLKTRRKLAYETPDKEKEKVPSSSPQSMSFGRSRSGRLLMPTLEFWHNQRAIYDVDRTITGFEGIHPEQQRKGTQSTPLRKKRQLT